MFHKRNSQKQVLLKGKTVSELLQKYYKYYWIFCCERISSNEREARFAYLDLHQLCIQFYCRRHCKQA